MMEVSATEALAAWPCEVYRCDSGLNLVGPGTWRGEGRGSQTEGRSAPREQKHVKAARMINKRFLTVED